MIATTVDEEGVRRAVTKLVEGERLVSCTCCTADTFCCVFPASCGKGPEAIWHYGNDLFETAAGSLVYGDATNGAALTGGAWVIYEDGVSRTQSCLGFTSEGGGIGYPEVGAALADSYLLTVTQQNFGTGSTTATYSTFGTFDGQCVWRGGGAIFQGNEDGFAVIFNKDTCRWELWDGFYQNAYAFLSATYALQQSPVGTYVLLNPNYGYFAIDPIVDVEIS